MNFITNELSSFYLDFTKDIVYIEEADSLERRSIQTVFYDCLYALTTMLTPIIPHTTEEVYRYMPGKKNESIYLCDMVQPIHHINSEELLEKYANLMKVRDDVLKALEDARNEKIIGKSLHAKVDFYPTEKVANLLSTLNVDLSQVFIVSKFNVATSDFDAKMYESGKIKVSAATGVICSRCWQMVYAINEDELCPRCARVVKNLKK